MRFIQQNGNFLFEGVVENRMDPLKLGRVQVRIFGMHTDSLADIPSSDLFWASVLMPVTSASTTGVGETPALVEGSHVVGYFRDGMYAQDPVVIGSLIGIPIQNRKGDRGFNDLRSEQGFKEGSYPGPGPYPRWLDEPDTPRLARNEKANEGTILAKKNSNRKTGIETPTGSFDEPASPYAAKYPFNKVIETESGHTIEYDDTPGSERVHIAHTSGTFIEMHPDGAIVIRALGDHHAISDGNKNEYADGYNLRIESTGQIYCKGDYTFKSEGTFKVSAKNITMEAVDQAIFSSSNGTIIYGANTAVLFGKNSFVIGDTAMTVKGGSTIAALNNDYSLTTGSYTVTSSQVSYQ